MQESRLTALWKQAADDLGIEITSPFECSVEGTGVIRAELLVHDFGGPSGTIVVTSDRAVWEHGDALDELGFGVSVLSEPLDSEVYKREDFIELLRDWGWHGAESDSPAWL